MREKLIEFIRKADKEDYESRTQDEHYAYIADYLIANGVTIQKWIPVSERLPENFGEYIVTVQEETGELYSDYADYDPYHKKWRTGLFLGVRDNVTHWMPLPEPPKEEM